MLRVTHRVHACVIILAVIMVSITSGCASERARVMAADAPIAPGLASPNDARVEADYHFAHGLPAIDPQGRVLAVIEIPAGSTAKFEVDKDSGALVWETLDDGRPRVINYLGYPANYGLIPGTLLPKEEGGDGDPLDVVVLGPARQRGEPVAVRIIGGLRLLDDGEQDDKLIAVPLDTRLNHAFATLNTLDELDARYPKLKEILALWFTHYDGVGVTTSQGWLSAAAARALVERAARAHHDHHRPL